MSIASLLAYEAYIDQEVRRLAEGFDPLTIRILPATIHQDTAYMRMLAEERARVTLSDQDRWKREYLGDFPAGGVSSQWAELRREEAEQTLADARREVERLESLPKAKVEPVIPSLSFRRKLEP